MYLQYRDNIKAFKTIIWYNLIYRPWCVRCCECMTWTVDCRLNTFTYRPPFLNEWFIVHLFLSIHAPVQTQSQWVMWVGSRQKETLGVEWWGVMMLSSCSTSSVPVHCSSVRWSYNENDLDVCSSTLPTAPHFWYTFLLLKSFPHTTAMSFQLWIYIFVLKSFPHTTAMSFKLWILAEIIVLCLSNR